MSAHFHFYVILAYLLVLAGISYRESRKIRTQEDFSVAGRSLSPLVLFGTMLATWIGTGSIFGNAEKTYQVGVSAIVIPLAGILGITVLSAVASRVRLMEEITIQDLLEKRYNWFARIVGVLALVIAYTTIVSYQYRAAGAVLDIVLPGINLRTATIIATVFIVIFTVTAGMISIAKVGLIQGITMIAGISITLPLLWFKVGGAEGMRQTLDASHFEIYGPIPPIDIVNILLPSFLLILGDANMYQRFASAKTGGTARKAALWCIAGIAFMECTIILTAWVASALEPSLSNDGHVIAYAARNHLPLVFGALMLTTIMAIILSTAGSFLLTPASCLVRDIYQRFINKDASERSLVILLRVMVVVLGGVAFYLSTLSDEFLSVALLAYTIYGAAITPSLMACFFWKRATGPAAVASILTGTAVSLLWQLRESDSGVDAVVPALACSVVVLVVVSLMTKPTPSEKIDPFFADA